MSVPTVKRHKWPVALLILFLAAFVLLAAVFCGAALWWVVRYQRCEDLLRKAGAARGAGKIEAARSFYNTAVQTPATPYQKAFAFGGRAAIELGRRRYDAALTDYNTALAADQWMHGLHAGRAVALQYKGEYARALDDYAVALREDPNDASVFGYRAEIFILRSNWPKALSDLNEMIRCLPDNGAAYASRAAIYDRLGDRDRAFNDYDTALRLNPLLELAYRGRSAIYRHRDNPKRADADELAGIAALAVNISGWPSPDGVILRTTAVHCAKAATSAREAKAYQQEIFFYTLALATRDFDAEERCNCLMNRAIAHTNLGDWQAAAIDIDTAIAWNQASYGAYVDRANFALHFSHYDDVISDCNIAIKLNPNHAEAFINRADAFAGKGQAKAAEADFATAEKVNPYFPDLYLHRAQFFIGSGRPAEALADLEKCAPLHPDPTSLSFTRGKTFQALGKWQEASDEYEQTLRTETHSSAGALNTIAWFYSTCPDIHFQKPTQAIALANRACDLTHWHSAANRDTLAAAYAAAGDFRAAIENQCAAIAFSRSDRNRAGMEQRLALYQQHKPYLAPK